MPEQPTFNQMLEYCCQRGKYVCVGLDPQLKLIPQTLKDRIQRLPISLGEKLEETLFQFGQRIIDATHEYAQAFKPNAAFFESHAEPGDRALRRLIHHIRATDPRIPIIYDAKRADIGSTNEGYATKAFDDLGADAITVHTYLGHEAMEPFLRRTDKGVIALVRTSNSGAGEMQDGEWILKPEEVEHFTAINIRRIDTSQGQAIYAVPYFLYVAHRVAKHWNYNGNCGVVVGATYPQDLPQVRALVGDMPILIPGIGAQGGSVEAVVPVARNSRGMGMIINSSRGIIHASLGEDFADVARNAAEKLNNEIQVHLV